MTSSLAGFISGPFIYVACIGLVLSAGYKVLQYAKMPRHLRWDLYPIAHEPKGSHYQHVDHWATPKEKSIKGELAFMIPEMVLLVKMFKINQPMWIYSFPMHFGLYLLMGWLAVMVIGAVTEMAGGYVSSAAHGIWPMLLYFSAFPLGIGGLMMGFLGTLGLFATRLTNEDLRDYSSPVTYFNLLLLLAIFGCGLAAWLFADPHFDLTRGYILSLIILSPISLSHPLMIAEVFLVGTFFVYLPHSRMFHFAAKYFFYHNVMWDDEAVERGGTLEKGIAECLNYQTQWSAQHVVPNETWLAQAVTNPTDRGGKHETKS